MITDDGNTTKAVTVVGVKVEEATAVAERVVGVAAVVEVEVGVAVAEVGAEATAVAEVGVRVVEATAAEDFSQRHRSQQDEKEKLRIPRATSASAYPIYNFPGHHKPPTRGTSAVHRKSNYRSR